LFFEEGCPGGIKSQPAPRRIKNVGIYLQNPSKTACLGVGLRFFFICSAATCRWATENDFALGLLPSRKGYKGQSVAGQNLTSFGCPSVQSRHLARIARSGVGGLSAVSNMAIFPFFSG